MQAQFRTLAHLPIDERTDSACRPARRGPAAHCASIDEGIEVGLHVEAQLYVAVGRQTVADFGRGLAQSDVPMAADTVMLWLSSGKPVAATAIMQLGERGLVELEALVSDYIPEFAQHGKEPITLRHLLTHTGGFRFVDIGWPDSSWDEIIDRICRARLERDWVPGHKAGYHPYTSWYILGEIVRRMDGRPFSQYVRDEIFLPLGMNDSWIGMPLEQYRAYGDRMGILLETSRREPAPHRYATAAAAAQCIPGGNAYGPMRELGRFYHMLAAAGTLGDTRILAPRASRQ